MLVETNQHRVKVEQLDNRLGEQYYLDSFHTYKLCFEQGRMKTRVMDDQGKYTNLLPDRTFENISKYVCQT